LSPLLRICDADRTLTKRRARLLGVFHAQLAPAYALKGESERAAAELAIARRLTRDDRYSSIARLQAVGYFGVPEDPRVVRSQVFLRSAQGLACRRNDRSVLYEFLISGANGEDKYRARHLVKVAYRSIWRIMPGELFQNQ
jgi:hypothetical protein